MTGRTGLWTARALGAGLGASWTTFAESSLSAMLQPASGMRPHRSWPSPHDAKIGRFGLLFTAVAGIFRGVVQGSGAKVMGRMIRHLILFAALFALWLLLSGHYTPLLLTFGAVSSAVVVAIVHRLNLADEEGVPFHCLPLMWRFWPWLTGEIVKANIEVMRRIISPRLDISPQLFHFRPSQNTSSGLVTHANSITLTPGTVTVEIEEDGRFLVHALTHEFAEGIAATVADDRIEGEIGQRITVRGC